LRAFGLAALLAATLPAQAAISVIDDTGATVTVPRPVQRVISLAPHATELLFAAGGGARIVGTVAYSDYPSSARDIPHVGDNRALDLERIAALKPDLVVVWRHGNAQKQTDRLRALGIPLYFSEPHRLADIPRSIEVLGTLLDTRASAHDAAQQFRQQADALRHRYASRPPVTVFFQVWEQPLMTLNGQHVFTDMLALCGGRNVFAGEPLLVPTVSTEAVIGEVEVRALFRASRVGTIAGCMVTSGIVRRGSRVRIFRDGARIHETTVAQLKRFKDDAREVAEGFECGILLEGFNDLREGDIFEVYETREVERTSLDEAPGSGSSSDGDA